MGNPWPPWGSGPHKQPRPLPGSVSSGALRTAARGGSANPALAGHETTAWGDADRSAGRDLAEQTAPSPSFVNIYPSPGATCCCSRSPGERSPPAHLPRPPRPCPWKAETLQHSWGATAPTSTPAGPWEPGPQAREPRSGEGAGRDGFREGPGSSKHPFPPSSLCTGHTPKGQGASVHSLHWPVVCQGDPPDVPGEQMGGGARGQGGPPGGAGASVHP